jgi:hypothetical protein
MINNNSLSGEDLFKGLYQTLMSNKDFINFGFHKIIILSVTLSNNREYNIHSNILIDNETPFEDYYLYVSKDLSNYNNLEYGYHNEEILRYNILCWNVDDLKNSKIKQTYNALLARGVSPRIKKHKILMDQNIHNVRTFSSSALLKSPGNKKWYKGSSITDILNLDSHTLIIRNSHADLTYNEKEEIYHGTEVNVAIASAITAEARINMSIFKNNPEFKIYYSDTDSIVTNKPLPDSMVGNALGQVKLEYVITKAVFLAPKVYAIITDEGKEIIKVKGLTNEVISKLNFSDLEALLIKDSSREFNQEKRFKSVINGQITTSDIIYTLKTTSNKRQQIYVNGIFNNTKPYNY